MSGLGKRLAQARKAAGLSLDGLSKRVSVSRGQIHRIEQELSDPGVGNVYELATVLGVDVGWLITGETPNGVDTCRSFEEFLETPLGAGASKEELAVLSRIASTLPDDPAAPSILQAILLLRRGAVSPAEANSGVETTGKARRGELDSK